MLTFCTAVRLLGVSHGLRLKRSEREESARAAWGLSLNDLSLPRCRQEVLCLVPGCDYMNIITYNKRGIVDVCMLYMGYGYKDGLRQFCELHICIIMVCKSTQ